MSSSHHTIALMRSVAVTALIGAAILAAPLNAGAQSMAPSTVTVAPQAAATGDAEMKTETVEQRISSLHTSLQITPGEETNWSSVAQVMRGNAATMEKLSAERTANSTENLTAIDDLRTYERFAHAHFEGLKNLIASFDTLYKSMPEAQKKVADDVFQSFGHDRSASRG